MNNDTDYWTEMFPDMDEQDIIDILESVGLDIEGKEDEDEEKTYSNFIKPKEPPTVATRLKKIFDMDD